MIPSLLLLVAAAMVLVRAGWGGRRVVAVLGWWLAAVGIVGLIYLAGAWGCAVGVLAGSAVALAAVMLAGWRSPPRVGRPVRHAPAVSIPVVPSDLARRVAVFMLVVPAAFAAAQWLALAVQHALRGHGIDEADAVVLGWFLQPIAWTLLMTVQMTRAGAARMVAPLAVTTVAGALMWGLA